MSGQAPVTGRDLNKPVKLTRLIRLFLIILNGLTPPFGEQCPVADLNSC